MKVLFLIRSLNQGGAERQLANLALFLARENHEVAVATFYSEGFFWEKFTQSSIRLINLRKKGKMDVLSFFRNLIRQVRAFQPDIVYSFLVDANVFAGFLKPFFPRIKFVWGVRASNMDFASYDLSSKLSFEISRHLAKRADYIIYNSRAGKQFHQKKGYPRENASVIHNGINTITFKPDKGKGKQVREELGIKQDEFLIGNFGRLDPMKDHRTFLEAARRFYQTNPSARFLCIGKDVETIPTRFSDLFNASGLLQRCHFLPAKGDLFPYYNALDVFTLTSRGEGFSNVISEALACGIPCVATNVGDNAIIIDDPNLIIPTEDPEALVAVWKKLLISPTPLQNNHSRINRLFSTNILGKKTELIFERLSAR